MLNPETSWEDAIAALDVELNTQAISWDDPRVVAWMQAKGYSSRYQVSLDEYRAMAGRLHEIAQETPVSELEANLVRVAIARLGKLFKRGSISADQLMDEIQHLARQYPHQVKAVVLELAKANQSTISS